MYIGCDDSNLEKIQPEADLHHSRSEKSRSNPIVLKLTQKTISYIPFTKRHIKCM